ncbi:MAG: hypothetical protein V3R64_09425 [Sphingomonadales bacterium]
MTHSNLFKLMSDGMSATETPEALLRHASRKRVATSPAIRSEPQRNLATMFTVQEAF